MIAEPRRHVPIGGAILALAAVALVAVIGVLVISGRPDAQSIVQEPPTTAAPVESPAPTEEPAVTADEAHTLLNDYVAAYDAEDPAALTALMTSDAVRSSEGEDQVQGADAIAAAYTDQFDAVDSPRSTFTPTRFEPAAGEASVSGTYRIASAGAPTATGGIAFHLVRVDGQLSIDRIAIVPD